MPDSKRILMLNYEFPPVGGGAANACYYMLKEFAIRSISIDLVTSSYKGFEVEKFSRNITIYKLPIKKKNLHYWSATEIALWALKAYFFSKKMVNKNNYDLCHCWFGWPSGIIGYLFRKKVPYIISIRGSDVPHFNSRLKTLDTVLFAPLSRIVWSNAKSVIANSQGLKSLALKTLNRNISVIPNGVDTIEFKPLKNKKIGKKIKLISTGRLIERKGYKYLIEALKGLNDNFELTIIGEGNQEKERKEQARKLNVNVNFKGKIEHKNISKELQNSDIFILPSLNEGMSNSVLEAMACGLPIVSASVGGSKELMDENGFIIRKKSVSDIKNALEKFVDDKYLILKQGKNSRKMTEKFNWKKLTERYLEAYS